MKMNKFYGLLVLILVGLFLIVGCSSSKSTGSQPSKEPSKSSAPSTEQKAEQKKQKYPDHPITVIMPYEAGGSTDVVGRKVAMGAEKVLGVPLMVVNKPGAAGAVGAKEVYNSKPDGYTLLAWAVPVVTHKLLGNLDFDYRDFENIIMHNIEPAALAVKKDAPWKTLQEFIDYAKKNPGKIKLSTMSPGGVWNVATIAMQDKLGLKFNVLEEGAGGIKVVLLAAGGHVDACIAGAGEVLTQVPSENVRVLGVMSPKRVPALPDVPTFQEVGYDLSISAFRAFHAPKGTPKDVIDTLYKAFKTSVDDPGYAEFLKDKGSVPMNLNPEETNKFLDEQRKIFEEIFTKTGKIKK